MSTQQELKRIARAFVEDIGRGEVDGALVTNDLVCWASSAPSEFGLPHLRTMLVLLKRLFPDGLEMTVDHVIVEGDRAAVMSQAHGVLDDGTRYDNFYHYALRFEGARICEMREYMDSALVGRVLSPRFKALMSGS